MKRRLPLILILAILAALVVALFLPRPLLKPNSDYEVLIVRYNPTLTQTSCWRSPSAKKWTRGTIGKPSGWAKQTTSTSESLCTASQTATPSRTNCSRS